MDIRDRIVGPIGYFTGLKEVAVDFGDLVRKLVLSEHFVLESLGLAEFPLMVRKFGYAGVIELLDSGLVDVQCEINGIASIGKNLPPGAYCLGCITAPDVAEDSLQRLDDVRGLNEKQTQTLRKKVADRILASPPNVGSKMIRQLHADIEASSPIFKAAIAQLATRDLGREVEPKDFSFAAFPIEVQGIERALTNFQVIQTETDLGERFGLTETATNTIVEVSLHGVANLNERFETMERFGAVTGFRSGELQLFEQKLEFLAGQLDPAAQAERFARVVELMDLPDVYPGPEVQDVDLGRLIEIAQGDEAQEFRRWLRGIDSMSDGEIKGEMNKLRETMRAAVQSRAGKVVRLGVTAGAGLIPVAGLIAGPAASALDIFVIDSLISQPGPTAFVSDLYASVFVGN